MLPLVATSRRIFRRFVFSATLRPPRPSELPLRLEQPDLHIKLLRVGAGAESDAAALASELQLEEVARPAASKRLQANGVLLDDEWCTFLAENDYLVGLSLDGPRLLHDAYRHDQGGRPVFDGVLAAYVRGTSSLCIFQPTCGEGAALEHNGDLYSRDH